MQSKIGLALVTVLATSVFIGCGLWTRTYYATSNSKVVDIAFTSRGNMLEGTTHGDAPFQSSGGEVIDLTDN
jgi:hypothetical protein